MRIGALYYISADIDNLIDISITIDIITKYLTAH